MGCRSSFGRVAAALALSAVAFCVAAADEQSTFLCISDAATGFHFASGKWESARFNAGQKYIVRPAKEDELKAWGQWVVVPFDEASPMAGCKEFNQYGWLTGCDGLQQFRFNRETLRFVTAYLIGYVRTEPGKENENTPSMEIGKCSPL
jgi:hypothetical protein